MVFPVGANIALSHVHSVDGTGVPAKRETADTDEEIEVVTNQTQKPAVQGGNTIGSEVPEPSVRRRALVRAASAVPVILTLHSGAALARSSNLVGTTQEFGGGTANCLETDGLTEVSSGVYDLGEPPIGIVNKIPDEDFYTNPSDPANSQVKNVYMCQNGGTFYKSSTGQPIELKRGALLSATALSSFAGRITVRDI